MICLATCASCPARSGRTVGRNRFSRDGVHGLPALSSPCGRRKLSGLEATEMPNTEKTIYRSPNGDQWYLVEEPGSERMFVRHQPNRASGGQSSLIEVVDFLAEGHGPQHEALLRLLGNVELLGNVVAPRQ